MFIFFDILQFSSPQRSMEVVCVCVEGQTAALFRVLLLAESVCTRFFNDAIHSNENCFNNKQLNYGDTKTLSGST